MLKFAAGFVLFSKAVSKFPYRTIPTKDIKDNIRIKAVTDMAARRALFLPAIVISDKYTSKKDICKGQLFKNT